MWTAFVVLLILWLLGLLLDLGRWIHALPAAALLLLLYRLTIGSRRR
ncbi:MAG: lmo0937 family membrane protein [Gemmatimonadetes bacterium]|nr:lmo0937 family membrane protein [Gemmatimonadota bacterium]